MEDDLFAVFSSIPQHSPSFPACGAPAVGPPAVGPPAAALPDGKREPDHRTPVGLVALRAAAETPSPDAARKAVWVEPNSGIAISHSKLSEQQLRVGFLSQYAFVPLSDCAARVPPASGGETRPQCTIGVVVRKTEAKEAAVGGKAYAVVRLWNLKGASNTESCGMSLLLCGSAYAEHYAKSLVGMVVLVMRLEKLPPKENKSPSPLFRVSELDQLRWIGQCPHIGMCRSSTKAGSACSNIVNTQGMPYCSYHIAEAKKELANNVTNPENLSVSRKPQSGSSAPSVALAIPPQQCSRESFIAVRGSKVVSTAALNLSTRSSAAVTPSGDYAGVVQERGSLKSQGDLQPLPGSMPSPGALGVTARGRQVLAVATLNNEAAKKALTVTQASKLNPSSMASVVAARKRERSPEAAAAARSDQKMMFRKSNFAPLASRPNPTVDDDVVLPVSSVAAGAVRVSALSAAVAKQLVHGTLSASCTLDRSQVQNSGPSPITKMTDIAANLTSAHDELRVAATHERVEAQLDKLVQSEKMYLALEQMTEQTVEAYYCQQCRSWKFARERSCVASKHQVDMKQTLKKFYQCEHCGYKVPMLGSSSPHVLYPHCLRCKQSASWLRSNAAPVMKAAFTPKEY